MSLLTYLFLIILISSTLFPSNVKAEDGATLSVSPSTGSFLVGDTFSVSLFANTNDNHINAVEVKLKFPTDKLQLVDPTFGKSFISTWVILPEYSNIDGTLNLAGIIPNPGINTKNGLITSISFRVKQPGEAKIELDRTSQFLKNDGLGTNILDNFIDGKYTLSIPPPEGPVVTSVSHPDKYLWYSDQDPVFSWTTPGVEGAEFSYELSHNPRGAPDNKSEGTSTTKQYTNVEDGIWFFNIKAKHTEWGGVTHFPILIDATKPAFFPIEIMPKDLSDIQKGIVSFSTTDNASGISHYEIKVENLTTNEHVAPLFIEATSPYRLPRLGAGDYVITIRAYDNAGNFTDSKTQVKITKSSFIDEVLYNIWMVYVGLIVLLGIIILIVIEKKKRTCKINPIEASEELNEVFDNLEKKLLEKLYRLEKANSERELNDEEREFREKIIDELQITEDDLREYFLGSNPDKKKPKKKEDSSPDSTW